jgi:hypothetical protein
MRNTGEVVTREFLMAKHYNTSFPNAWSPAIGDFLNCDPIEWNAGPQDTEYTTWVNNDLIQDPDTRIWRTEWVEVDKFTPEERAEHDAGKVEAAINLMKFERDQLLAETDYTDLLNTPITAECRQAYIEYRQALRDITTTQSDPFNVVWPTKPQYIKA